MEYFFAEKVPVTPPELAIYLIFAFIFFSAGSKVILVKFPAPIIPIFPINFIKFIWTNLNNWIQV